MAIAFGTVALPGLLVFIPGIHESAFSDVALIATYVAPLFALISWLLAVVATVRSGVRLIRRRNTRASAATLALAAPGAILGAAALVLVYIYIGNVAGAFHPNEAARAGELAVGHYLDNGATLICDDGNNGHGPNSTPWYTAYIDAPSALGEAGHGRAALAAAGFSDAETADIPDEYELPVTTEAFEIHSLETRTDEYDGAPASPLARIDVFPVEPVPIFCSPPGGEYGDDRAAADGRATVVVHVQLESTR